LLDNSSMADYKYKINKNSSEPITLPAYPAYPACPTDKVCKETFINYAESRVLPDWMKRNLLDRRFKDDVKRYKYLKYAEISLDKSQNCIYSSIRLDGKYIAIGVSVYLDSGELDMHKINLFVYTLPDMELVMDTVHELSDGINIELVDPDIMFFNGGILWQDTDNTCNYEIVSWDRYRLWQYNKKVRDMLYINGSPDGTKFIYEYGFPRNTHSKYKYVWGRNKAHLDVYMNVLDAEPGITDGLFNKYSLDAGTPDKSGLKPLKKFVLESAFRELPAELIIGIFEYMTVDDKLVLLQD
jgi:hypothetical protein